jgi:peptidoglycan/xylan/chitin deacetylase (PgdA/CDA1 family)
MAFPALTEAGLKAAFFVTTGFIGTDNHMTEDMIRELSGAGMMIGSHAKTHRFLTDLSDDEVLSELESYKEVLERITGGPVDSFSAPGGRIDRRVEKLAREAGYRWIFSSEPVVNDTVMEGTAAGRFAVMRNRSPEWFARVISGSPPASAILRQKALGLLKKVLGTDLYLRLRKSLLGEE